MLIQGLLKSILNGLLVVLFILLFLFIFGYMVDYNYQGKDAVIDITDPVTLLSLLEAVGLTLCAFALFYGAKKVLKIILTNGMDKYSITVNSILEKRKKEDEPLPEMDWDKNKLD